MVELGVSAVALWGIGLVVFWGALGVVLGSVLVGGVFASSISLRRVAAVVLGVFIRWRLPAVFNHNHVAHFGGFFVTLFANEQEQTNQGCQAQHSCANDGNDAPSGSGSVISSRRWLELEGHLLGGNFAIATNLGLFNGNFLLTRVAVFFDGQWVGAVFDLEVQAAFGVAGEGAGRILKGNGGIGQRLAIAHQGNFYRVALGHQ